MWHEPSPSIEVLSPDRREAARHTVTSRATLVYQVAGAKNLLARDCAAIGMA
jgi:hypothetical protein